MALELGLTDTAGPSGYFADLASGTFPLNISRHGRRPTRVVAALTSHPAGPGPGSAALNPAEHFYLHLLDLVEKVFDGELEQTTFEENMRFMFGTRAFVVFTLDKLCAAICKQVREYSHLHSYADCVWEGASGCAGFPVPRAYEHAGAATHA